MKNKLLIIAFAFILYPFFGKTQTVKSDAFDLLNLNYRGLEHVKALHEKGNDKAAAALLDYYRNRTCIHHPDVDLEKIKINDKEKLWADEGLEHKFFAHKGYQPSYFYGENIDWEYWPIQDNELRWQLHRHKWWSPMGKMYRLTKNEKYAKEWIFQYCDWIQKNPLINRDKPNLTKDEKKAIKNMRFAWRPLEVSHRLQDQTGQFLYFNQSKYFTPEFLADFLVNYHKHAEHIFKNYSKRGNHLLFEAQRMIYAGAFFPEFKDAEKWRESGMKILSEEIKKQVYEDGMQYELDPHYHLAAINIFYKALQMADVNGFRNEFPDYYLDTVEKMISVVYNMSFPDYTMPCFGDAKAVNKKEMMKNYKRWQKVFPDNQNLTYFASNAKKGAMPSYCSNAFKESGYYIFRNGWKKDATVMVFKAGPPAFWHNQPDNGTFELYINGRNFFPDAGSYVYGGNDDVLKARNWFRQTMVHNTLTLNNQNIEETDSKRLLWDIANKDIQKLVVENQSYADLKHRRTVFFVDETFFVIVDEAIGKALGKVGVHYQLSEGKVHFDKKNLSVHTTYKDNNNIVVKAFGSKPMQLTEEEGWVSYDYRQKSKRPAFVFETDKIDNNLIRYITVVYPFATKQPEISAHFASTQVHDNEVNIHITINHKNRILHAAW